MATAATGEEAVPNSRPVQRCQPGTAYPAVLQGAFILAKATDDASVAAESIDHLRRQIE
jgi:hypothetical protein